MEKFSGEAVQLVKLRNPLSSATEYTGTWSRDMPAWMEISQAEQERLKLWANEGEFWISYTDFIQTFSHLEVVHLDSDTSRDEPSLHNKYMWQMRLFQGKHIEVEILIF